MGKIICVQSGFETTGISGTSDFCHKQEKLIGVAKGIKGRTVCCLRQFFYSDQEMKQQKVDLTEKVIHKFEVNFYKIAIESISTSKKDYPINFIFPPFSLKNCLLGTLQVKSRR